MTAASSKLQSPRRRPFDKAFRWMLLVTVLWSFTALAATGELPALFSVGGYILIITAWFGENHFPLNKWIWRAVTFIAMIFLVWYFETQARTDAIIYLLLFLLVNKLWTPKRPRDIMQVYIICFFFLLSASILTMSMAFLLFFIGFVFLLVIGLAFLTVRREHEMLAALGSDRMAGVNPQENVPNEFYLRAGGVVLVVFFFTFWIFTLFPRFSQQKFVTSLAPLQSTARTGFASDIRLGSTSEIEMDATTVMRVVLSEGREPGRVLDNLYLRGAVLEHYDNGHWSENPSAHVRERVWLSATDPIHLMSSVPPGATREVRQRVYLNQPTRGGNLFTLENAIRVQVAPSRNNLVEHDHSANTVRLLAQSPDVSYSAVSRIRTSLETMQSSRSWRNTAVAVDQRPLDRPSAPDGSLARVLRSSKNLRDAYRFFQRVTTEAAYVQAYLQLPSSLPRDRMTELAQQISRDRNTDLQKAQAVEAFLQDNYKYSTKNLAFGKREPTEAFLFEQKQGHCEYFASAMALLLRHLNIPSRIVNGYYTDRWNDMGAYYQVEKSDAHSWVEAWIHGMGWVAFDPSPPAGIVRVPATKDIFYRIRSYSDAIKMKWRLYVIDYDFSDQVSFVGNIARKTPRMFEPLARLVSQGNSMLTSQGSAREMAGRAALGFALLVIAVFVAVGSLAVSRWSTRRRNNPRQIQASLKRRRMALYEKILRALERKGMRRAANMTPLEFARGVEAKHPALSGFTDLTRQYYEIRFAERPVEPTDLELFEEFLKKVRSRETYGRLQQA